MQMGHVWVGLMEGGGAGGAGGIGAVGGNNSVWETFDFVANCSH